MKIEGFIAAHAAFKKQNGRLPSATELLNAIGLDDAKSLGNVRQAIKRAGLVLEGARGPTPKVAKTPRKPAVAVAPTPSRSASRDPVVASLIAKRDALRSTAAALDVAIEALSVAL